MFGNALQKFAIIKKMPLEDLLAMLGKKSGEFAKSTGSMVKSNPGESAAVAGIGALGANALSSDPQEEQEEEILRAYGLR